jgi:hypothetical protein
MLTKKQQHIINILERHGTKISVTITKHDGRADKAFYYNENHPNTQGYITKRMLASLNRRDLLKLKINKFPQAVQFEYTLKNNHGKS